MWSCKTEPIQPNQTRTMKMPMAANSIIVSNSQNSDCGNLASAIIILPEEFKAEDVKKDFKQECVGVKQEPYFNDIVELNGLIDVKPQTRLGDIKPNEQLGLIDIKPQLGLCDMEPHDQELIDIKPCFSEICDLNQFDSKPIEADLVWANQGGNGGHTQQTHGQYVEQKFAPIPIRPKLNPLGPKPIEIIPKPEMPPLEGTDLNLEDEKIAEPFCRICNKVFDTHAIYRRHSAFHDENRPSPCHVCPLRFLNDAGLRNHMRHHYSEHYFPCALCGQSFPEYSGLRGHLAQEHPRRTSKCKKCGEFLSRAERRTHSHSHSFHCADCGKSYLHRHRLDLHKCEVAPKYGRKTFICQVCQFNSKCLNGHIDHIKTHEGERNFACQVCGEYFSFASHRNKHVRKQHPKANYMVCSYCGLKLKNISIYKKHLKKHREKDSRLECDACGLKCKTKQYMAIHKAEKHGGPLPRECQECGERFLLIGELKKHIKEKHSQKNTSEVSTSANLNATQKEPPKHQCKHCQKTFSKWMKFQSHVKTHKTIVKAFKCDFCEKTYNFEETRAFHIWEKHGGPMPYACNHCGEGFTAKAKMMKHIKTSHAPRIETGDDKSVWSNSGSTPDLKWPLELTGESYNHLSADKGFLVGIKTGKFCSTLRHVCQDCGAAFSSKLRLLTHICNIPEHTSTDTDLNGNQKIPPKYLCEQRRKTPSKKKYLGWAKNKKLERFMKAFKCDFCNRSYRHEESRLRHIWEKHGGPMPYACNQCGEGFTSMTKLANHIKTSHAPQEETGNDNSVPSSNVSTSDLQEQDLTGISDH